MAGQVGDPEVCYINPEFSPDGTYAVWFEPSGKTRFQRRRARGAGAIWHCQVDLNTGAFIPPDCKGFKAFESTSAARANLGVDRKGNFYIGGDTKGRLVWVRPTGPTTGDVRVLPTASDPERRAIYPSRNPESDDAYVFWIKSHGAVFPGRADWVELRYIDLDNSTKEITLDHQTRPAGTREWAPMDVSFVRWLTDTFELYFGRTVSGSENPEIFRVNVAKSTTPEQVTSDRQRKLDPYPFLYRG